MTNQSMIESNINRALGLAYESYAQFVNIRETDNLIQNRAAVGAATSATAGLVYIQFAKLLHTQNTNSDLDTYQRLFDEYENFVDSVHRALATNLGYDVALDHFIKMKAILQESGYSDLLSAIDW